MFLLTSNYLAAVMQKCTAMNHLPLDPQVNTSLFKNCLFFMTCASFISLSLFFNHFTLLLPLSAALPHAPHLSSPPKSSSPHQQLSMYTGTNALLHYHIVSLLSLKLLFRLFFPDSWTLESPACPLLDLFA